MNKKVTTLEWERKIYEGMIFVGWIDLCNGTMFRLTSFKSHVPFNSLFVALEGRGNYYFSFNSQEKHPNYIAEKLSIPMADAKPLADWINIQMGTFEKLYGEYLYTDEMITKHANLGESQTEVLIPRIKNDSPNKDTV